jgi:hypothetical protein
MIASLFRVCFARLLLTAACCTLCQPASAALVGLFEFNDPSNWGAATTGSALSISGTGFASVAGTSGSDGAVAVSSGSFFTLAHGISPNNGGSRVNAYSLVFDVLKPADNAWYAFFQTGDRTGDADYFIRNSDNGVGVGTLNYSTASVPTNQVTAGEWFRVVFSADMGNNFGGGASASSFTTTVTNNSGNTWSHSHNNQALDGRHSLGATLDFFQDNDGEDSLLHVSTIAIFDNALSIAEATALGSPLTAVPEPTAATLLGALAISGLTFRRRRISNI